jgi:hypothetical protein
VLTPAATDRQNRRSTSRGNLGRPPMTNTSQQPGCCDDP